jgi:hypothetical protein
VATTLLFSVNRRAFVKIEYIIGAPQQSSHQAIKPITVIDN